LGGALEAAGEAEEVVVEAVRRRGGAGRRRSLGTAVTGSSMSSSSRSPQRSKEGETPSRMR
jgi:hypothetical protein